jgi:prepilin-type N-terminal cleavage/methylation domain-containing protein
MMHCNSYYLLQHHKRKAFSLLESIVALVVLGVTMTAIFTTMRASSNAAHHARMQTKAALLAEKLLVNSKLSDQTAYETTTGEEGLFAWKSQLIPTSIEGLGKITVTIIWNEQQVKRDFELISFLKMKTFTSHY